MRTLLLIAITFVANIAAAVAAAAEAWDRPVLGVSVIDFPDKATDDEIKWPAKAGVVVRHVVDGGPAAKAGIGPLDVIIEIGREKVNSADDFKTRIGGLKPEKIPISFFDANEIKGQIRFRRRTVSVTPVTFREIVKIQLVSEKDEASGATIVKHRDTTDTVDAESGVQLRIKTVGDQTTLAMRINHVGDELLSIRQYTFVVDGQRYTIDPKPFDVKFDVGNKQRWEWYDVSVVLPDDKSEIVKLARALANAKEAKVFYQGARYKDEGKVSSADCDRIAVVMAVLDTPAEK